MRWLGGGDRCGGKWIKGVGGGGGGKRVVESSVEVANGYSELCVCVW